MFQFYTFIQLTLRNYDYYKNSSPIIKIHDYSCKSLIKYWIAKDTTNVH